MEEQQPGDLSRRSSNAGDRLQLADLRWKIRANVADVLQKIFISGLGAFIAGIFYVYQDNETQSRYVSDLQAQRERADADLRATMFNTLFQAYFKNKMDSISRVEEKGESDEISLKDAGEGVMLSDLLARNFDTVDVRPLFEDIDLRLAKMVKPGSVVKLDRRRDAYELRENLRRAAYGVSARQIGLLQNNAGARVYQIATDGCDPAMTRYEYHFGPMNGTLQSVKDGTVEFDLYPANGQVGHFQTGSLAKTPIAVSFYDMPMMENLVVDDNWRLALVVTSLLSSYACEHYRDKMDDATQSECPGPGDPKLPSDCYRARLAAVWIPKDFVGVRDRPDLKDLLNRHTTDLRTDLKRLMYGQTDDHTASPHP